MLHSSLSLRVSFMVFVVVVQLLSHAQLFGTPWTGFPVLPCLPEFAQTHVCWVGDAIQPSHPSPLALNLSQYQGLFQWTSCSHQGPKDWSVSSSTSPSNEYSGLISFRIDWFDLLAVQGTLESLLQHHTSKASILGPFLWSTSNSHTRLLEKP